MKKLMFAGAISLSMMATGVMAQHEGHMGQMDHNMQKNTDSQVSGYRVDPAFKDQLTNVYKESLNLNEAFVKGSSSLVSNQIGNIQQALKQVNMHLLEGQVHMDWMKDLNVMLENLNGMRASGDIAAQRKQFAAFSQALYHSIKAFGVSGIEIYYQFCPMALDSQGAYWLSDTKEIRNPYMGSMMLTCGTTMEVIN